MSSIPGFVTITTQQYEDNYACDGFVKISKQAYESLLDDEAKLNALENNGVDNWQWYDVAMEEYRKARGEVDEG